MIHMSEPEENQRICCRAESEGGLLVIVLQTFTLAKKQFYCRNTEYPVRLEHTNGMSLLP